uniref:EF-hand domain-containing protein n=1 Tax=Caenorhabditis japonica TaxID=281687 RepID=A0A8R1DMP6_CAEJA
MDSSDDEDLLLNDEEEDVESQKDEVDSVVVEDVRRRLLDVFKMFDEDCDGLIEVWKILDSQRGYVQNDDVGHVLRSFGLNPSQSELQLVIEQTAKKTGRVSFDDLLPRVVSAIQNDEWKDETPKQIHAAFQVITSNNYVQKDTLLQLMTSIGEPLSAQEVKQFLNHVSVRANGDIDWVAYVKDTCEMIASRD